MATTVTQALTTRPNPANVSATRARRLRRQRGDAIGVSFIGRVRKAIAEAMHGVQQARGEWPIQRRAQHRQMRVQGGDVAAALTPQRVCEFGVAYQVRRAPKQGFEQGESRM